MTSRSIKLSPAWVLTVVTADSFLLFQNNMFHSLNSIVSGNKAIPNHSARMRATGSIHGFTFVSIRRCSNLRRETLPWYPPELEAVSAAEIGALQFPCSKTGQGCGRRAPSPAPSLVLCSSKLQRKRSQSLQHRVAGIHHLISARAFINAELETFSRRRIHCFILTYGKQSCGSSPLNLTEWCGHLMCGPGFITFVWVQWHMIIKQDAANKLTLAVHPCWAGGRLFGKLQCEMFVYLVMNGEPLLSWVMWVQMWGRQTGPASNFKPLKGLFCEVEFWYPNCHACLSLPPMLCSPYHWQPVLLVCLGKICHPFFSFFFFIKKKNTWIFTSPNCYFVLFISLLSDNLKFFFFLFPGIKNLFLITGLHMNLDREA